MDRTYRDARNRRECRRFHRRSRSPFHSFVTAPSFELISSVHLVDAVDIISDASLIQRNANPFVPRIVDLHFLFFLPLSRLLRNSPREEFRSQLERIFSRFGWSIRSSVIQTKMAAARQSFFFYRGERGVEGALAFDEKPIVFHGRAET